MGTFAYCFRGGKPGEVPKNAQPERECDVVHCSARGQMSEEDLLKMATLARDACVEVYMFMRAAVVEWEEDVEREQVRLEERCRAVAAAVKEHGVDGADGSCSGCPTGREGRERGGTGRGVGRGRQAEKPRANPRRWRRRRDDADVSLVRSILTTRAVVAQY